MIVAEPFAGTAALSLRLSCGSRALASRSGSKSRSADGILSALGLRPGGGVRAIVLADGDPLVRDAFLGLSVAGAEAVAVELDRLSEHLSRVDPEAAFPSILSVVPSGAAARSARALWLQGNTWKGFGRHFKRKRASATDRTDYRCCLRASTLARRVRALRLPPVLWTGSDAADARRFVGSVGAGRILAYLDPPYRVGAGYGSAFPRSKVVEEAVAWRRLGASVAVSESEPVAELVDLGWEAVEVGRGTGFAGGDAPVNFARGRREFLTASSGTLARTVGSDYGSREGAADVLTA